MLSEALTPSLRGRGILFIVSAPAGTGKTTLVQMLVRQFPAVASSISCTTRAPRAGEIDGVHYHFLGIEEFEKGIQEGRFLEHVSLYGHYYGTCRLYVEEMLASGRHIVLVIDTQGALKLIKKIDCVSIFIQPPSVEELERRLTHRGTENSSDLKIRLNWAKHELSFVKEYQYTFVNDQIDMAYEILKSIVIAECHKLTNVINL